MGTTAAPPGSTATVRRDRAYTRAEVRRLARTRGARLLVLDGEVFDFEGFAHPGGTRALDRHAGEDVSALFRGEEPADDDREASARDDDLHDANDAARPRATFASRPHAHGPAARRILRALRVGRIDPEDPRPLRATEDRAGLRLDDRGEDRSSVGSAGSDDDDDDEPKADMCAGKLFSSADACFGASDAASSDAASTPSDLGAIGPQSDLGARGGAQRRGGLVRFAASLAPPAYREWVHSPTHSSEPLRFFDNDAFEALTRTSWWVVPLVWVPVGISALATATRRGAEATPFTRFYDATPTRCREEERIVPPLFGSDGSEDLFLLWSLRVSLLVAFALGVLSWSLLEYGFHRFVFHASPRTSLGCAAHFLLHGCHHKAPTDAKRLVFPPALAAPGVWAVGKAIDALAKAAVGAAVGGFAPSFAVDRDGMSNASVVSSGLEEAVAGVSGVISGSSGCSHDYSLGWTTAAAEAIAGATFAGCLLGYVAYDCAHYALHHASFDAASWWGVLERRVPGGRRFVARMRRMKSAHMAHHYRDCDVGFGVTTTACDRIFGTSSRANANRTQTAASEREKNR